MESKLLRNIICIGALLLPMAAFAEVKIGYLNLSEIMEKSPQAEAASKTLEKEFSYRYENSRRPGTRS